MAFEREPVDRIDLHQAYLTLGNPVLLRQECVRRFSGPV
jgi:hypothetical protein